MRDKKPWAVLVYLVSDDQRQSPAPSLDAIAEGELDLMFAAHDRTKMHLAVQVDYRFKNKVWRHVERQPEVSLPESSASDPVTIKRFLDWAYPRAPADRYLIVFWGHAFGTAGLFPDSRPGSPAGHDLLSLEELRQVMSHGSILSGGQPVDVVLFKNCCLSNLETAYQLRDCAEFMIGSQARMPAEGWPYKRIFDELAARSGSDLSTEEIARRIVGQLAKHYADTELVRDVPVTLLRLGVTRQLREPMRRLADELIRIRDTEPLRWRGSILEAIRRAASVGDAALPDVVSLCRNLRDPSSHYHRSFSESVLEVEQVVERQIVVTHHSKSSAFNGAGVFYRSEDSVAMADSIVASAVDLSEYQNLALCRDTRWSRVMLQPAPQSNR